MLPDDPLASFAIDARGMAMVMAFEKQSVSGNGGRRANAGRKAGVKNRRTVELIAAVEQSGQTPLEYLLCVMRDAQIDPEQRLHAAAVAAPYVHPKLSAVAVTATVTAAVEALTTEERTARIEMLISKACD